MRMWEELSFRDFKSYGWQWQRSRVWKPERANVLWLVMSIAYVWVISMGTRAADCEALRKELTRGKKRRISLFTMGLRFFQRWLSMGRRLAYSLRLTADPTTQSKTVVY